MDTSNYAKISTGDPEEDQRQLHKFALGDERMRNGMCPNGCPVMLVTTDIRTHGCPECKFVLYGTMGENIKHA